MAAWRSDPASAKVLQRRREAYELCAELVDRQIDALDRGEHEEAAHLQNQCARLARVADDSEAA